MIQLVPQLKILLAVEPVDFRKGIDTLAAVCKQRLSQDPMSGALFVFRNKSGTAPEAAGLRWHWLLALPEEILAGKSILVAALA